MAPTCFPASTTTRAASDWAPAPPWVPDLAVGLEGTVDGEAVTLDMLVEVDRTGRGAYNAKKFAAYDQFLGGWCKRTADFKNGRPLVVFVADEARAIPALMAAAIRS